MFLPLCGLPRPISGSGAAMGRVWLFTSTGMQIMVHFILTSICEDGTVISHYTDRETEAREA